MKIDQPSLAIIIIAIIDVIIGCFLFCNYNLLSTQNRKSDRLSYMNESIVEEGIKTSLETTTLVPEVETKPVVYDGMTLDELSSKLNRSLTSTLEGTGYLFASRSIELGLDPYLAVAIVLHETGCKWQCSQLVSVCNNVGGMKGSPGCFGGSYKAFNTLEEGINSYLDNLYYNYYALGLTTAETINPKYAESTTWASKVNYYINYIKQN